MQARGERRRRLGRPAEGSALVGFLFQLIPVILIVGAFIFIMNQSQGGGGRVMQFGKASAKLVTKDQPKTTFADVAGVEEAIEELQEVKEYLANPASSRPWARRSLAGCCCSPARVGQDAARARGRG